MPEAVSQEDISSVVKMQLEEILRAPHVGRDRDDYDPLDKTEGGTHVVVVQSSFQDRARFFVLLRDERGDDIMTRVLDQRRNSPFVLRYDAKGSHETYLNAVHASYPSRWMLDKFPGTATQLWDNREQLQPGMMFPQKMLHYLMNK